MAIAEREITQQLTLTLSGDLHQKMEQAALASGQTVSDFIASSLRQAAEAALEPRLSAPAFAGDPLDSIIGIFKDSPELDALMGRIHEDQRQGIEQFRLEAEAEKAAEQAKARQQ